MLLTHHNSRGCCALHWDHVNAVLHQVLKGSHPQAVDHPTVGIYNIKTSKSNKTTILIITDGITKHQFRNLESRNILSGAGGKSI